MRLMHEFCTHRTTFKLILRFVEMKNLRSLYLFRLLGLVLIAGAFSTGCISAQQTTSGKPASGDVLQFEYTHVSFGPVVKGETRDTVYHFTNISNEPVQIDLVSACDCTTYTYPEEPIPPGGKGTLAVTFDSSSKEENETLTVDIILKNVNPATGYAYVYQVSYDYDLKLK